MGSSSGNSGGEKIKSGLCFPLYQAYRKIQDGDTAGGIATAACPVGVGATFETGRALAKGDYREAAGQAGRMLGEPLGFGAGSGAQDAGYGIYDFVNEKNKDAENLETNTEENPLDEQGQMLEEEADARDVTNQQGQTARKAAYQAAINSGATPAQAQAAADAQTTLGNAAGNYTALRSAGNAARASERERYGYADALGREAQNLNEGRKRAIGSAVLGGAGQGASTGISLFGNGGSK